MRVYDKGSDTGKPWTDRLWQDRKNKSNAYTTEFDYTYDTKNAPFGTSNATSDLAATATPLYISADVIGGTPGNYSPTTDFAGAPYGCEGTCISHARFPRQVSLPDLNTEDPKEPADSIEVINKLFATVLDWWQLNEASGRYEDKSDEDAVNFWDVASNGGAVPSGTDETKNVASAPVVSTVITDNAEGAEGITVNGENREVALVGGGGSMAADIRFYFEANPNQMPVRYVRVEAGNDSGYRVGRGSYPNQRPEGTCKNAADAEHFGEYDGACKEHPFRFIARYDCPRGSGADLRPCLNGANPSIAWSTDPTIVQNGCWDPNFRPSGADETTEPGACVFRPRVQVQDNWGYCTNAVGKTCTLGLGGDLCYDASPDVNECITPESWVPFAGRIVVTPP